MSLRRIFFGRATEKDPDPERDRDPLRNPTGGTRHKEGRGPLASSPPPPPRETRKPTKPPRPARASRPAAARTTSTPRKSKARSSQPILGRANNSKRGPASRSIVGRGRSPLSGGKKITGRGGMPKGKKIR
jgi:hypothetical protein